MYGFFAAMLTFSSIPFHNNLLIFRDKVICSALLT
nr:MAG TPA: hypothetical protein [Caudoviricetes sp.]